MIHTSQRSVVRRVFNRFDTVRGLSELLVAASLEVQCANTIENVPTNARAL